MVSHLKPHFFTADYCIPVKFSGFETEIFKPVPNHKKALLPGAFMSSALERNTRDRRFAAKKRGLKLRAKPLSFMMEKPEKSYKISIFHFMNIRN